MTDQVATWPHARWRTAAVVGVALAAMLVTAGTMLRVGRVVDPWTAVLVASGAVALWSAVRGNLLPRGSDEHHDEVDPDTGVGNARAVLSLLDREAGRARSYGSVFSVAVVEVDRQVLAPLHPRRAHRVLVDLVRQIATDVRVGDRVNRVSTSDRELVVVVLPDTGSTGAHTFADRVLGRARRHLLGEGTPAHGHVRTQVLSHPDDAEGLRLLQRRLEVLEGTEALIRDVRTRPTFRARRSPNMPVAVADADRVGSSQD